MPIVYNLVGQTFGRLTVIEFAGFNKQRNKLWKCNCACGTKGHIAVGSKIIHGETKSCGCLRAEHAKNLAQKNTIHGHARNAFVGHQSPEYTCYMNMLARCYKTYCKEYKNYGARGITVYDRWRFGENDVSGFECFLKDMKLRPSAKHSIERKNNNIGYSKRNCVWATRREQMFNTRRSVKLVYKGNTYNLDELIRKGVITRSPILKLVKKGYTHQEALDGLLVGSLGKRHKFLTLNRETKTLAEWSRHTGLSESLIYHRIKKLGWTVREALTIPAGYLYSR